MSAIATELRAAPIVKWAGGKQRLLPKLQRLLPADFGTRPYVEPFVGGGALFFSVQPKQALLGDLNSDLIEMYRSVRDELDEVISRLKRLASAHSPERYYRVRASFNSIAHWRRVSTAQRAAEVIYLNKTCFNGLYRVNRDGDFNVPLGSYKNPTIVNECALRLASAALASTTLISGSYESIASAAKRQSFVYLDPPYATRVDRQSFTGYTASGFGMDEQERLRDLVVTLHKRGCQVMLSNANVAVIRDLYKDFDITVINAPRAINSVGTGRGFVKEVVIRNYVGSREHALQSSRPLGVVIKGAATSARVPSSA
jgi:DNA adenine methylase